MRSVWFFILFGSLITYHCFTTVSGEEVSSQGQDAESKPSYTQCKPYVDAALKGESSQPEATSAATGGGGDDDSKEDASNDTQEDTGASDNKAASEDSDGKDDSGENDSAAEAANDDDNDSKEAGEAGVEEGSKEENKDEDSGEDQPNTEEKPDDDDDSKEAQAQQDEDSTEDSKDDSKEDDSKEDENKDDDDSNESTEAANETDAGAPADDDDSKENADNDSKQDDDDSKEAQAEEAKGGPDGDSGEDSKEENQPDGSDSDNVANTADQPDSNESQEEQAEAKEDQATASTPAQSESEPAVNEEPSDVKDGDSKEDADSKEDDDSKEEDDDDDSAENSYVPRSREHLVRILALADTDKSKEMSTLVDKATQTTLKELKSVYENAIKPLETLYKYRDLSNRHFGDPEIFSKPMVVFMGPWSGGKSTIINWLLGIQDEDVALRTGADPSPAQFNIMTHGSEDEVLDGTQLAADWTFSGLQKFGQAFLDRLRGRRLPNRLLEKVNLVEIPGILEVRKQVERSFPFNDACQWFIDRADILFLVYDPAKLDIGPETEAILDQLKGRENQVRIVLNKADSVKPDELLRLQANLIWNISPLMASAEPPILYVASLWGRQLNPDSPTSLLLTHENHFLQDIRDATEKRVETRIAAARRFAVRVRNHAKMCDCYLNTYNNHRSFFSNKKKISDDIIEHPQNYHIYEGLSTLTNISRYDLPDPDSYKDFFRLNPLWEFPTLASTCTYFRGCPINKLDIAIAYDLPELLGRYRRQREAIISAQNQGEKSTKAKHK